MKYSGSGVERELGPDRISSRGADKPHVVVVECRQPASVRGFHSNMNISEHPTDNEVKPAEIDSFDHDDLKEIQESINNAQELDLNYLGTSVFDADAMAPLSQASAVGALIMSGDL
jgi:hypothetical protein